jgi:hypothetical protein
MSKDIRIRTRQEKLEFAVDDTWQRLPSSCRSECKSIVTRILLEVIQSESEERTDDEQQD